MVDKNKHKIILIKILKDIYSDPETRTALGFKGGTAAFLFYNLPRLSVDLDFDLLEVNKKEFVLKKISLILASYGKIIQASEKRFTLFFLLSYEKGKRKVKVEISKRPTKSNYETKNYLGIPVLLIKKEDMVAGKLAAFLTRKKFASRDLFDLWFFLKNEWEINEESFKNKTGLSLKQGLKKAVLKLKNIKIKQLLRGVGELLKEKQKYWVKENLKNELLFYLKLYLENL